MSIGKNAIKRVENNGYSKVECSAPDMENSNVIANLDAQVMEKLVAPVEKKTEQKPAPQKKSTAKKTAPKATAPKAKKPEKKAEISRVEVGDDMPYYLL